MIAAELSRDYGENVALKLLLDHERESSGGADNGLDIWNNDIGIRIGTYVRKQNGSWADVVRLARLVVAGSFSQGSYNEIKNWKMRSADEGIRLAYDHDANLKDKSSLTFEKFSNAFDRRPFFRANDGTLRLDDGNLVVNHVAMTSPQHWTKHPKIVVNGKPVELSVSSSLFPTRKWFSGEGFVYEKGNNAPRLSFPEHSLKARASTPTSGSVLFSSRPIRDQQIELVPPAMKSNVFGERKPAAGFLEKARTNVILPQKVNERAVPSLEMRRNDSEPELPVPIKKPEKRSTLKPRSRFSLNPFSLSKPRLEQQAAMLAHNPLRARQLIIDAGREPQLFGLA